MNLTKYFRDAVSELHRVSWPTRQQAIRISIVVLAVTFVIAFMLGFLDTFLAWGYQQLLKLSA
ncbi:MAG: preprotein translocase subunit SecE [Candidatus Peribacteraceae bacterium]|nr:preprotein translocase subunit SecE [Candidatus Peribacteraceae bacterium]